MEDPLLAAGRGIEGDDAAVGRDDIHGVADYERLIFRLMQAGRGRGCIGIGVGCGFHVINPRGLQVADIRWSYLGQGGIAFASRIVTDHWPIGGLVLRRRLGWIGRLTRSA